MKKILKVIGILAIFFITIIIFVAIDTSFMVNDHDNDIEHECTQECGLGMAFLPIISTWKYSFLMTILAICAKFSKKLDSTTKNTIYFLPIISLLSLVIIIKPVFWIIELFNLIKPVG